MVLGVVLCLGRGVRYINKHLLGRAQHTVVKITEEDGVLVLEMDVKQLSRDVGIAEDAPQAGIPFLNFAPPRSVRGQMGRSHHQRALVVPEG